jgi:class 3 adenylate cyclase/tetratricopeptide (TPR) repeat protein
LKWGEDPKLYCELTAAALAAGDSNLVHDFANEGLRVVEDHQSKLRLARDRALAMAQEGRLEEAEQDLLGRLEGCAIGTAERREIASALGRLSKDRWYEEGDFKDLAEAIRWYRVGYEEGDGDVFPAINVASLHAIAGEMGDAKEWAEKVMAANDDSEWGLASQGEALLILGDVEAAAARYRGYHEARRDSPRDVASTRKQAERLLDALGGDRSWLDASMPLPCLLVFSGVVPDLETDKPRFPESEEERVRQEITAYLAENCPVAVYCSAAAGSDIILLEEAAALGIETQIALPASVDEFRRLSVEPFGEKWTSRFDAAIASAARVECLGRHFPSDDGSGLLIEYGSDVLLGSAMLRAETGGFGMASLAVWDRGASREAGGPGEFVARWDLRAGSLPRTAPAKVICPLPEGAVAPEMGVRVAEPRGGIASQEMCAMLFADVKNYSALTERMLPLFENLYMREISRLLDVCTGGPSVVNTWGDAVYMVFPDVRACGDFALAMNARLNAPDAAWRDSELPSGLSIRTAVHAGPVFRLNDPVTRSFMYTGSHVTHAARLEPVTQPGQVYATEAFAALAALGGVSSFGCHYIGQRRLAKDHGEAGVYRLVKTHT